MKTRCTLLQGPNMNFKPGDLICVEHYSIKLYGKVVKIEGDVLFYRNEIGQLFSTPLADVKQPEEEMLDYLDF